MERPTWCQIQEAENDDDLPLRMLNQKKRFLLHKNRGDLKMDEEWSQGRYNEFIEEEFPNYDD